jgi:predicted nucleic acid-binding protein
VKDFVDTSAWFAYFVPTDQEHERVRDSLLAAPVGLLTTDYCVCETLTLLLFRGEHRRALDAGHAFFEENIAELHVINLAQVHRAWILFRQRAASGWSFTDCTSRIVIGDLRITRAIALDQHFREFGITVAP